MNLLTVKDVAAMLKVSKSTVYQWANAGLIPTCKINGTIRFKEPEILEWIDSSRIDGSECIVIEPSDISNSEIDRIIQNSIASVIGSRYTASTKGKPGLSSPERRD